MSVSYTYPAQYPRHEQAMQLAAVSPPPATTLPAAGAEAALFGSDGFTFKDLLDVVNPLQQLPIISSLYRSSTGDTISAVSRMAGGFLLGGPVGFVLAALNSGLEAVTGGDAGEHMLAMLDGGPGETQVASAAAKYEQAYWLS